MRKIVSISLMLAVSVVLTSCGTRKAVKPQPVVKPGGAISGPNIYNRPGSDGAPWWDIDVSHIPDAVPMPHNGRYKAAPYTVMGTRYFPIQSAHNYSEVGTASWYGTKFHGQNTANGEQYDLYGMTAAHKTLPLPSYVKVTNLENGLSVTLRVNDRGPFYSDRIIDLSFAAAKKLGYADKGVARVKVEGIDPAKWWAQRGQPVPLILADGKYAAAPAQGKPLAWPKLEPAQETYVPPVTQHASATVPEEIDSKKNATFPADGLYLQVGAFANPDAAQLLRDKLSLISNAPVAISSTVRDQTILHRVRLGPIVTLQAAEQLQEQIARANLGQAALVKFD